MRQTAVWGAMAAAVLGGVFGCDGADVDEHPCKIENHCLRVDGEVRCENGFVWEDPADPENYNCIVLAPGGDGDGDGDGGDGDGDGDGGDGDGDGDGGDGDGDGDGGDGDGDGDGDPEPEPQPEPEPLPVVFEGTFTIENQFDVDDIAPFTEITGSLIIDAAGMTSATLPNLVHIGDDLVVDPEHGCPDLALPELRDIGLDLLVGERQGDDRRCALSLPRLTDVGVIRTVDSSFASVGRDAVSDLVVPRLGTGASAPRDIVILGLTLDRLDLSETTAVNSLLLINDLEVAELDLSHLHTVHETLRLMTRLPLTSQVSTPALTSVGHLHIGRSSANSYQWSRLGGLSTPALVELGQLTLWGVGDFSWVHSAGVTMVGDDRTITIDYTWLSGCTIEAFLDTITNPSTLNSVSIDEYDHSECVVGLEWDDDPPAPDGWTCGGDYWNDGLYCDCNCGAPDMDCDDPTTFMSFHNCPSSHNMCLDGVCIEPPVPASWTCPDTFWNDGTWCDCNCGGPQDPDCDANHTTYFDGHGPPEECPNDSNTCIDGMCAVE